VHTKTLVQTKIDLFHDFRFSDANALPRDVQLIAGHGKDKDVGQGTWRLVAAARDAAPIKLRAAFFNSRPASVVTLL
jgi:hypothetical protein